MTEKFYEVEIKTTVVVLAEDEIDAYSRAREDMSEIKSDTDFDVDVIKDLTGETLPTGWDGMCIPYGGDGNVRIKDLCA